MKLTVAAALRLLSADLTGNLLINFDLEPGAGETLAAVLPCLINSDDTLGDLLVSRGRRELSARSVPTGQFGRLKPGHQKLHPRLGPSAGGQAH